MARRKSDVQRAAESAVKKTHPATIFLAILFFLIGCAGGVFVSIQLTKNDRFDLNGEKVIRLEEGASYTEQGATVVSFGKDISAKVVYGGDAESLKGSLEEGIYQIVYTIDDLRWGDYQRVRVVIVGNPEGADEFVSSVGEGV